MMGLLMDAKGPCVHCGKDTEIVFRVFHNVDGVDQILPLRICEKDVSGFIRTVGAFVVVRPKETPK